MVAQCEKACHVCGKPMQISQAFVKANVSHLACAEKETEEIQAVVCSKGLDKAKAFVNQECPHA